MIAEYVLWEMNKKISIIECSSSANLKHSPFFVYIFILYIHIIFLYVHYFYTFLNNI